MDVTLEGVMRCLRDSALTQIAISLLSDQGLSKEQFHQMLREIRPNANESTIDLLRMNTVGGLRSYGFLIQGGRKGRTLPYRIIGFQEPAVKETTDNWSPEDRFTYDSWISCRPEFDPNTTEAWLELALTSTLEMDYTSGMPGRPVECNPVLPSMSKWFENSYGNLSSYKIQERVVLIEGSIFPGRAVIVQKNRTRPKFTIINYGMQFHEIFQMATDLGRISYGNVIIENVAPEELPMYREAFRNRGDMPNPEAMYDCAKMVWDPSTKFGSRAASYVRKYDRECVWIETEQTHQLLSDVVTVWKDSLEDRHRRLPITRDYRAIVSPGARKRMFLGLRDDHPVTCVVTDGLINDSTVACKIVEKSLNYSSQPGGKPGTSAWTLVRTCQSLLDHGVQWYNGGRIYGGESGLAEHKLHLADDVIKQYDYDTNLRRKEG